MKKVLLLLFTAVFCLLILIGCSGSDTVDISAFSRFLDSENFVPDLGQGEFLDQLQNYRYEGIPITERAIGTHMDGANGGGYTAGGKWFGFSNFFNAENGLSSDSGNVEYSNRLWTTVALDGMELPYGISFDDSMREVFQKIGISRNPYNFSADPGSDTDMTLHHDDKATLVLQNLERAQDPAEHQYPYVLIYTETYVNEMNDGTPVTVQRTVKMSFGDPHWLLGHSLCRIEIGVVENYERMG